MYLVVKWQSDHQSKILFLVL